MNELATYQQSKLPDTLGELSKFILFGQQKLTAVRAEIHAIRDLKLAKAVEAQKMEEARMMSEALLDAQVLAGELTKAIPQAPRINNLRKDSGVTSKIRSKKEVLADLGITPKQANRYEALADNKDLVEQVKQEARENDDIPTRTQVLNLAAFRKKQQEQERQQIDADARRHKAFATMISGVLNFIVNDQELEELEDALIRSCNGALIESDLADLDRAIGLLTNIRNYLAEKGANHGKKK